MRTIRGLIRSAAVLAPIVAALALGACGGDDSGDDTQTFENDAYPFTFDYPGSLSESSDVSFSQNLGESAADSVALALDQSNGIILQKSTLNASVTSDNLDAAKQQFDRLVGQIDHGASGKAGETVGFPSLTYSAVPVASIQDGQSEITFLFDGENEYVINCQSTPDQRDAINSACDEALQTLTKT